MITIIEKIISNYKTNKSLYIGEKITIAEHMIQSSMLAEKYTLTEAINFLEKTVEESYPQVHHLTSVIQGSLNPQKTWVDLLEASWPGGSITGAPKLRSMEIIEELEPDKRSIYCGSIAYIGFDGNMDSNICIRTFIYCKNKIHLFVGLFCLLFGSLTL